MTKVIDRQEFRDLLVSIIDERGPGYKYAKACLPGSEKATSCLYAPASGPDNHRCLIGEALSRLGLSDSDLQALDRLDPFGNGTGFYNQYTRNLAASFGVTLTDEAYDLACATQTYQDNGHAYGLIMAQVEA